VAVVDAVDVVDNVDQKIRYLSEERKIIYLLMLLNKKNMLVSAIPLQIDVHKHLLRCHKAIYKILIIN
jgi:hypothetical protein